MNLFLITADGELVTPELTGSILEGVTRDSILTLAGDFGLTPVETRIEIAQMLDDIAAGKIVEVFACGTAAVITPIGGFKMVGREVSVGDGSAGEKTVAIRHRLLDIQYGRAEDTYHWMHRVA